MFVVVWFRVRTHILTCTAQENFCATNSSIPCVYVWIVVCACRFQLKTKHITLTHPFTSARIKSNCKERSKAINIQINRIVFCLICIQIVNCTWYAFLDPICVKQENDKKKVKKKSIFCGKRLKSEYERQRGMQTI